MTHVMLRRSDLQALLFRHHASSWRAGRFFSFALAPMEMVRLMGASSMPTWMVWYHVVALALSVAVFVGCEARARVWDRRAAGLSKTPTHPERKD